MSTSHEGSTSPIRSSRMARPILLSLFAAFSVSLCLRVRAERAGSGRRSADCRGRRACGTLLSRSERLSASLQEVPPRPKLGYSVAQRRQIQSGLVADLDYAPPYVRTGAGRRRRRPAAAAVSTDPFGQHASCRQSPLPRSVRPLKWCWCGSVTPAAICHPSSMTWSASSPRSIPRARLRPFQQRVEVAWALRHLFPSQVIADNRVRDRSRIRLIRTRTRISSRHLMARRTRRCRTRRTLPGRHQPVTAGGTVLSIGERWRFALSQDAHRPADEALAAMIAASVTAPGALQDRRLMVVAQAADPAIATARAKAVAVDLIAHGVPAEKVSARRDLGTQGEAVTVMVLPGG